MIKGIKVRIESYGAQQNDPYAYNNCMIYCQCDLPYKVNIILSLGNLIRGMDLSPSLKLPEKEDAFHRQAFSGLSTLLKNSMGQKFLSFFEEMVQSKPTLQQTEEQIASNMQKINTIIDEIHSHISKRLQNHERQVLEIVKEEMKEMNEQVRRLVFELNEKITQKNENEEVWYLNNELDYFKNEALKLFETNKDLRIEVKLLKKSIRDYELQLTNKESALYKIKKRQMKQKSYSKKLEILQPRLQSMRQSSTINEDISKKLKINEHLLHKKRMLTEITSIMKTEVEREDRCFDEESRVNIRISNKSYSKHIQNSPLIITISDDNDRTMINNSSLQGQALKSCESNQKCIHPILLEEEPSIRQCFDKSTQTHDNFDHSSLLNIKKPEKNEISDDDTNEAKAIDLFRSGFKLNSTHRKTKRVELPLRSSVDYHKSGMNYMRSMNNSFLKNRVEDNFMVKSKKEGYLFKKESLC